MVKEGLYIENMKADVDDISTFAFTYKNSDVESPEAIKNSYSKSVQLKGTNTNNQIFGQIWNLDREIVEGNELIGAYFNPKKRASFQLYDNGELLESGYIKLDSIDINNNEVSYSLTLFGELGNFFYNLMYDESDKEITMANLKLGLDYEPDDKNRRFFQWNAEYIKTSWEKLQDEFNPEDMAVNNWVTAAPTYSGYYDDFSNDKVIVAMNSLTDDLKSEILPSSFTEDNKEYTPRDGYGLLTTQREMSEWEVRDLRSLYQRPAIKTSLLLNAISNPENNGGYKVKWDEEFKNSPYFTKSYIVCNRLKWEDGVTNLTDVNVGTQASIYTGQNVFFDIINQKTGTKKFDFSHMMSPRLQLTLNEQIYTNKTDSDKLYTSCFHFYKGRGDDVYFTSYSPNIYGAFVYKIHVYENDIELPNYSFTKIINIYNNYNIKRGREILTSYIENLIGTPFNEQLLNGAKKVTYPNGETFYQTEDFMIDVRLPQSNNISIKIEKFMIALDLEGENPFGLRDPHTFNLGSVKIADWCKNKLNPGNIDGWRAFDTNKYWYKLSNANTYNNKSSYYDGITSNVQQVDVTKSILLDSLGTPFKILTDFCKLFNLRFRLSYDDFENKGTINIEYRHNYFINEVVDISDRIDYSKSFNIKPTTSEYKFYKFGMENEESYATTIYKKKYSDDYSSYIYNSNYNFNNDTNNLFEDSLYNVAIDYRLNSPYFNTAKQKDGIKYPQICLTPMYTWKLWRHTESAEKTIFGLQSYNSLPKIQDYEKMCFFDKENSDIDMISLAFFNGFQDYGYLSRNNGEPYLLTNNLPIMNALNDGDNACFIYGKYQNKPTLMGRVDEGDSSDNIIGYWITKLPKFSPNYKDDNRVYESFYFKQPSAGYVPDDYNSAKLLYNTYWKNYITDLYDDGAKQVECYVFIKDKPDVALRKLYYFKNSIWTLNEITDYNYREYVPVKCTFVKIKDIADYTNNTEFRIQQYM